MTTDPEVRAALQELLLTELRHAYHAQAAATPPGEADPDVVTQNLVDRINAVRGMAQTRTGGGMNDDANDE